MSSRCIGSVYARTSGLRACAAFLFSTLASLCASAQTTIHVPADQPTIQAGINAAHTGDTVLVGPGTYYENIDFKGKAITVTSSAGAATTIIDGSAGKVPAVSFVTGETRASKLVGFTVQNGGTENGNLYPNVMGGIFLGSSQPTIANNIITNNHCYGIYSSGSSPLIIGNEIDNTLDAKGGCTFAGGAAIWLFGSYSNYNGGTQITTPPAEVTGNIIQNNTQSGKEDAGGNGGVGVAIWGAYAALTQNIIRNNITYGTGAVYAFNTDNVTLIGNLIYGNRAGNVGGVALEPPDESAGPFIGILENNTIYGNTATSTGSPIDSIGGSQVYLSGNLGQYVMVNNIVVGTTANLPAVTCGTIYNYLSYTPLVFDHNDIFAAQGSTYGGPCPDQTGTYGNISADPRFVNSVGGDFHLQPGSPALDAGNNSAPELPATDLDNTLRLKDATGLGYPVVDMGAYEAAGLSDATPTVLNLTPSTYFPYQGFPYGNQSAPFILTAKITSSLGVPTGSVTFYEDGINLTTLTLDPTGAATYQPPVPTPGVHAFTASYPGQGAFPPAVSVKFFILFPKITPSLTLTSSLNPSTAGASVTFTVQANSSDNAVLSPITLTDTSTNTTLATLTPNSAGTATFTTSSLTVGYHYLTASYAGDSAHNSASAFLTQQVVNPYATTTTVSGTPNPSVVNNAVTLNATVTSSGGGAPTGAVNFTYGSTTLGSAALTGSTSANSATASISTSTLPVGFDTVTATYVPTGSFAASSGTYTQQVLSGYPTTTTLTVNANPAQAVGAPLFAAHVAAVNPALGIPAGTVSFADGGVSQGTAVLDSNGNAKVLLLMLNPGPHTITATYVPASTFAPSTGTLIEIVTLRTTTAELTNNPATPVAYGTTVSFNGSVNASAAAGSEIFPSGTFTFLSDGNSFATVPVTAMRPQRVVMVTFLASASTSALPVGTHTITCSYNGDTNFAPSTCGNSTQLTVTPATSSLTLASAQNPSPALTPIALTASLTSSGSPLLNAPVIFTIDGKSTTVSTTAAGVAMVNATLNAGSHTITATYAGDTNHTGSGTSLTQVAVANPTTIALIAAPNPATQIQVVTVGATVHASTGVASPYGTIALYDVGTLLGSTTVAASGSNGPATVSVSFPVSGLSAGTHNLTAAYTPADANFLASTTAAPLPLVITPADLLLTTDGSLSVQAEHYSHLAVTLQSVGGLSGSFSLACGPLPAYATCTFAQPTVTLPAGNTAGTTLEIDTDAVHHFKSALTPLDVPGRAPRSRLPLLAFLPPGLLPFAARRRKALRTTLLLLLFTLGIGLTGCGDKYPDHTPPGTYNVQVTATSIPGSTPAPLTRTATFQLVVTP